MIETKVAAFIRKMDRMGLSAPKIARLAGVSRGTVRRYIDMEVFPPPPRHIHRASKLDPHRERISAWVREDLEQPRSERRSVTQIWQTLRDEHGFEGSYRIVARYVRWLRQKQASHTV